MFVWSAVPEPNAIRLSWLLVWNRCHWYLMLSHVPPFFHLISVLPVPCLLPFGPFHFALMFVGLLMFFGSGVGVSVAAALAVASATAVAYAHPLSSACLCRSACILCSSASMASRCIPLSMLSSLSISLFAWLSCGCML